MSDERQHPQADTRRLDRLLAVFTILVAVIYGTTAVWLLSSGRDAYNQSVIENRHVTERNAALLHRDLQIVCSANHVQCP